MSNMAGCEADAVSLCSLPASGKRNWRFIYFFWMVNPGEAGVVVGSAANGRQKSGSAGLREPLYVTERTCTLNTPDPSLTLCSHA